MFILHSTTIFYIHLKPNRIFIQPHYQVRSDHAKVLFLYFFKTFMLNTPQELHVAPITGDLKVSKLRLGTCVCSQNLIHKMLWTTLPFKFQTNIFSNEKYFITPYYFMRWFSVILSYFPQSKWLVCIDFNRPIILSFSSNSVYIITSQGVKK